MTTRGELEPVWGATVAARPVSSAVERKRREGMNRGYLAQIDSMRRSQFCAVGASGARSFPRAGDAHLFGGVRVAIRRSLVIWIS